MGSVILVFDNESRPFFTDSSKSPPLYIYSGNLGDSFKKSMMDEIWVMHGALKKFIPWIRKYMAKKSETTETTETASTNTRRVRTTRAQRHKKIHEYFKL